jgi:hypothetical protein
VKATLLANELIVKEGSANLQRGLETVGGQLLLTNHRLIFEAHSLNLQRHSTVLELTDVVSTTPCWTKLFGLIPLVPNSLAVRLKDEKEYRFVLFGRKSWDEAIKYQLRSR